MHSCPSCGAPSQGDARFCNHCGAHIPVADARPFGAPPPSPQFTAPNFGTPAAQASGTRVCPGCGAIAPRSRQQCVICNASLANAMQVPPLPDGMYFAGIVECDFACRACGLRSPLDALDADGEVECRRCGLAQKFDVEQWEECIGFAQDVADCGGPPGRRPPFANSPYATIGETNTFAEKTLSGMVIDGEGMKPRSLRVRVTPGHPLCDACKVPLAIDLDGQGHARTTCPRCQAQAIYGMPNGADDVSCDIAAVIADDHRTDRPPVRVQPNPGGAAVALTCPQCNAALSMPDASGLVTCNYCRTPARVPSRTLWKLTGQAPSHKRWWVLFDDDSPMRFEREHGHEHDDDDELDPDSDDRMARVRAAQAAQEAQRVARAASKATPGMIGVGVALVTVAALMIGGVIALTALRPAKRATDEANAAAESAKEQADEALDEAKKATKSAAKAASAAKTTLDRGQYHDLKGCTCKVGSDTAQLAIHLDLETTGMTVGEDDGFVTSFDLSWILDAKGKFFRLEDGGAPPRKWKGRGLGVGVACSGDTFAVIAGDKATAWSLADKKPLWTTTLPSAYAVQPTPAKKGLDVTCDTLGTSNVGKGGALVRVPLAGGKTQSIKLSDGSIVK